MKTFNVTIRLVVDEQTDEHIQDAASIESEILSWLTDLGADVEEVQVS